MLFYIVLFILILEIIFIKVLKVNRNFMSLSDCQKMVLLFSNEVV